jgi:hypothetical protein
MKKTFVGMVKRAEAWDQSKPPQEQDGFAGHAAFMAELETDGLIAMAGLLKDTGDVLFVFLADDEEEIRHRMAQDPWQRDGHVTLIRLEEAAFRIGAPAGAASG